LTLVVGLRDVNTPKTNNQRLNLMSRAIYTTIGFLFFTIGLMALVLSLVGVQLSFLTWIDKPGRLFGFIIRILMILAGVVIVVLARTDWREEEGLQDL